MRPDTRAAHNPVFDRIKMNVIDMAREILLVANGVFPKAPLPDAARSPLLRRLVDTRSVAGNDREKADLISRHRVEKSASSSGKRHIVCKWSGRTTIATVSNGCRVLVYRNAMRRQLIFSVRSDKRRSTRLSVKKKVPPGAKFRR